MTKTMIKKSLRAYISRSHFEFAVLLDGKVVGMCLLQFGKQPVHRRLKLFVVLAGLRSIDEIQQRDEVPFLRLRLIPDIADQGRVVQPFRLDPEIFTGLFSFTLGVEDKRVHKFQDILLAANVVERVIPHRLLEIHKIQTLDAVSLAVQKSTDFVEDGAFSLCLSRT